MKNECACVRACVCVYVSVSVCVCILQLGCLINLYVNIKFVPGEKMTDSYDSYNSYVPFQ